MTLLLDMKLAYFIVDLVSIILQLILILVLSIFIFYSPIHVISTIIKRRTGKS